MYRIPNNTEKATKHYERYAEKVRDSVKVYWEGQSESFKKNYTGRFLKDIANTDVSKTGSGAILKTLLTGDFNEQKALINKIDVDLKLAEADNPGEKDVFYKVCRRLFVDDFYGNNKYFLKNNHIEAVGIDVCPYCGHSYIYVVNHPTKSNDETKVKPQIDHFLPKSVYPYLALNYYNLIPSCSTCNEAPCKRENDPIGQDRSHEYLMQPYEFRTEDIVFEYIPTTSFYEDFSVGVDMKCANSELDKGYKEWLALDKLYEKHNRIVTRMYVQLESIVADKYNGYLKDKFKVPSSFMKDVPNMIFGYDLKDEEAPYTTLHKFRKDIFRQIKNDISDNT